MWIILHIVLQIPDLMFFIHKPLKYGKYGKAAI